MSSEMQREEAAVAVVAKITKTHDEAVARFYHNRNSQHIFNENEIVGRFVEYVLDAQRALDEERKKVRKLRESLKSARPMIATMMHQGADVSCPRCKIIAKIDAALSETEG